LFLPRKLDAVEVRLLGPLRVETDQREIAIGPRKQRALFSLLALHAGRALRAETLVNGLWGEEPPRSALKTLQTYVASLRKVLPDGALRTTAGGYVLDVPPSSVDAHRFEELARKASALEREGALTEARQTLSDGLALWRGTALAELADSHDGAAEAARLDEMRRTAEEQLSELRLRLGEHEHAVADLETAVAAEPLRERRWAQLMTALYRCGRQAEALRAYQRLRTLLAEELGIGPSDELSSLEDAILRQDPELAWQGKGRDQLGGFETHTLADPPAVDRPETNLPHLGSSFVGRAAELGEISELVRTSRVVTLAGPGGVGKTRLALEAASRMIDDERWDGVWFVELAPVSAPEQIESVVVATLGLHTVGDRPLVESMLEALAPQRILIVLDNCEHLIEAAAKTADEIERSCPRVHLLVTSREPLDIPGERVYRVPSLSLPSEDCEDADEIAQADAVALFAQRAKDHDASFVVDPSAVQLLSVVCRRLDGIPLALELAAARLASMSLDDLAARLHDRFRILTRGSRVALPRQQTLRAAISWSFDLLNHPERDVIHRLSVFAGSFDIEAVEAVCQTAGLDVFEIDDLLDSLVSKSLALVDRSSSTTRYRLLETVRQFAAEEFLATNGEEAVSRARAAHAAHYVSLAERSAGEVVGPLQAQWLRRLDFEWENIRATFEYLAASPDGQETVLRLAVALRIFLWSRGHVDLAPLVEAALAQADGVAAGLRGWSLAAVAQLLEEVVDDRGVVYEYCSEARSLARITGDSKLLVHTGMLGSRLRNPDGPHAARHHAEEAVRLARDIGDPDLLCRALISLDVASYSTAEDIAERHTDQQRRYEEEALGLARQAGDLFLLAGIQNNLAYLDMQDGDPEAAQHRLEEAMQTAADIGDKEHFGRLWHSMGCAMLLQDRPDEAVGWFRRSLADCRRRGHHLKAAAVLSGIACCLPELRDPTAAATLHGASDAVILAAHVAEFPVEKGLREDHQARLRLALGADEFDVGYDNGRMLPLDVAMELAMRRTAAV
jgi:predicted ATPase/DNA-binding SARP family transcriptional activator